MGEDRQGNPSRRAARFARSMQPLTVCTLLLLAGCGTWHQFVPADAPDSELCFRLTCLGDSVSIVITHVGNHPYRRGVSDQFLCNIEIRSLARAIVDIRIEDLGLVIGDVSYPLRRLVFDEDDRDWRTTRLTGFGLTLPQDEPADVSHNPRAVTIDCCVDGVEHEGLTDGMLEGCLQVTARDGRRAEVTVRVPLVKISRRRPHRWST